MERLGAGPDSSMQQTKEFDRLEQFAKLQAAPKIKFTDLEEAVNSKVILNPMPFDVRTDFVKVTSDTVLVPVTIQMRNRDITFVNKDGIQRGTVNIFARLSTLTGKIVQTFEDTVQVDVPAELLPRTAENASVYWKALPLRAGRYKLNIAVKDVNGDRKGVWSRSVVVPEFSDDKLATSTLIVADDMEAGSHQGDRHRHVRDRHHEGPAPRRPGRRQAGSVQERQRSEAEFLDAGL